MAAKKKPSRRGRKPMSPFDLIVARLTKNPNTPYADIAAEAKKKKLAVYPIMYGRAKLKLGLVKRGKGKASTKKAAGKTAAKRGPGRPRGGRTGGSKSDQVRELLGSGLSGPEIAKKVGCTPGLVYAVKSKGGVSTRVGPRRPGRPRKNANTMDLNGLVSTIQTLQTERDDAIATLEKIRALLG